MSPTQGQYNLSLAGNNWTYFQIHTTNYISNFIGVSLRSTTSTRCAGVSLVCGAPVQQWLHLPPSCRVWTCLHIIHSFHNPTRLCWQKCSIINTHTYRHKYSLICRQERECLYIGRTHRHLLYTIVSTYTIVVHIHILTMVEYTHLCTYLHLFTNTHLLYKYNSIQQVPIDWPALFSSTN